MLMGMTRSLAMFLRMGSRVLKKNNLEFSRLIEVPKATEKSDRMDMKDEASLIIGSPIRRVSSTNCWRVDGRAEAWG